MIVSIPPVTPVTTPPDTEALPLLALHVPPVTGSVSVMALPWHSTEAPEIVPAVRNAPIVTALRAMAVPQLLETVYLTVSTPGVIGVRVPALFIVAITVLLRLHTPPETALL